MFDYFEIPEHWGLSVQQELVIGSLLDDAGVYLAPHDLCIKLYDEPFEKDCVAPAKLRVLIQRCRDIVRERSSGRVKIEIKRGTGWRITKKGRAIMKAGSVVVFE